MIGFLLIIAYFFSYIVIFIVKLSWLHNSTKLLEILIIKCVSTSKIRKPLDYNMYRMLAL